MALCRKCGGLGLVTCTNCGGRGSSGSGRCFHCAGRGKTFCHSCARKSETAPSILEADDISEVIEGSAVATPEQWKADYAGKYERSQRDVETERQSVIQWVNTAGYDANLTYELMNWLSDLPLEHPETPNSLAQFADKCDGSLQIKLRSLASAVQSLQFYKSMMD